MAINDFIHHFFTIRILSFSFGNSKVGRVKQIFNNVVIVVIRSSLFPSRFIRLFARCTFTLQRPHVNYHFRLIERENAIQLTRSIFVYMCASVSRWAFAARDDQLPFDGCWCSIINLLCGRATCKLQIPVVSFRTHRMRISSVNLQ